MKRGALIVLEGCDCSGKTLQSRNLVELLKSHNVPAERMCYPDRTTATGKVIDSYLKSEKYLTDQAIHLLFSANRWEAEPLMKEKLNDGVTLIIDRYSFSGVAYSFAKKGHFDLEWYKNPERGLPKPDLVLFLDLKQEVINQRRGFGTERYEKKEFQETVNEIYYQLKDETWKVVNADMPENDLSLLLMEEILPLVKKVGDQPLSKLWWH